MQEMSPRWCGDPCNAGDESKVVWGPVQCRRRVQGGVGTRAMQVTVGCGEDVQVAVDGGG